MTWFRAILRGTRGANRHDREAGAGFEEDVERELPAHMLDSEGDDEQRRERRWVGQDTEPISQTSGREVTEIVQRPRTA